MALENDTVSSYKIDRYILLRIENIRFLGPNMYLVIDDKLDFSRLSFASEYWVHLNQVCNGTKMTLKYFPAKELK